MIIVSFCVCVFQRGESALHMAARAGQMEVVRCLLRNGALVDAMARVYRLNPHDFLMSLYMADMETK